MRRLFALALLFLPKLASAQDTLDPGVAGELTLTPVLDGLGGPTGMEFLPDGRLVLIQQSGEVFLWDGQSLDPAGTIATDDGGERGLLGVAVDPMFAQSNRLYFYYSEGASQRVAWTTLDPQTNQLDTGNMTAVIQNLSANRNHDGGALHFGRDGYLYIGVGDTGCNCGCAPGTNTNNYFPTCLTKYHGKILRIDRDGNAPATNPLVGVTAAPACGGDLTDTSCNAAEVFPTDTADPLDEIYLWGFRNPWRLTIDSQTGYLWIGDVGETTWEEITISKQGGEHHGWPFREGMEGDPTGMCPQVVPQSTGDCIEPAFAYPHTETPASGQGSISGGVFSNHCAWPEAWHGLYWFGDYNKSRVWTLTPNETRDGVTGERTVIVRSANGVVHFAAAPDGSIYYATINDGQVWRIAPANPAACPGQDAGVDAGPPDAIEGADAAEDSGQPQPDAEADDSGEAVADAALEKDAGSTADTGAGIGIDPDDEDCGCTTTHRREATTGAWILFGLFALRAFSSSRRRRDQPSPADR